MKVSDRVEQEQRRDHGEKMADGWTDSLLDILLAALVERAVRRVRGNK